MKKEKSTRQKPMQACVMNPLEALEILKLSQHYGVCESQILRACFREGLKKFSDERNGLEMIRLGVLSK